MWVLGRHVRECPDFAEKGTCETKGCKLPHVIRANRNRKVAAPTLSSSVKGDDKMDTSTGPAPGGEAVMLTAEDGQLGDEYISLTFKESESEEEESDEEESMDEVEGESGSEDNDDDDESMSQVHT
ncbi:hypothetical protein NLJ89_g2858 [Agrocybe chaxingu]|uniref:C3H1-type domain-containing protein n=1 Tax=Agrocybe chaxingu TaxID=84603 RepID=A0A9W8K3L6_9AGAR|nr:hypothetical protein NLJ89_g2858 [Agrocybe chaxingu]